MTPKTITPAEPPPHRGTALPCVIDIEASGFGAGSFPVEVGIALPDGSAYCTLIRPAGDWTHWDGSAERLHGITRALLERHGRDTAEVAAELNRRLRDQAVYCDNWAHDYSWLARLFDSAGCTPQFQLHHLREIVGDGPLARFDEVREAVTRTLQLRRHRASSDARVLQLCVARLCAPATAPPLPPR